MIVNRANDWNYSFEQTCKFLTRRSETVDVNLRKRQRLFVSCIAQCKNTAVWVFMQPSPFQPPVPRSLRRRSRKVLVLNVSLLNDADIMIESLKDITRNHHSERASLSGTEREKTWCNIPASSGQLFTSGEKEIWTICHSPSLTPTHATTTRGEKKTTKRQRWHTLTEAPFHAVRIQQQRQNKKISLHSFELKCENSPALLAVALEIFTMTYDTLKPWICTAL